MQRLYFVLMCACALFAYSCKRVDNVTPPKCTYTASEKLALFSQKWLNTYTQVDTYNAAGTSKTTSLIYPIGYFQLNGTQTYNVLSDNVPFDGTWTINSNCQLVLDSNNVSLKRAFDVVTLTKDSLTIRRKQNNIVYTQHYKTFYCPSSASLQYQWDNGLIRTDYFVGTSTAIAATDFTSFPGYFKMNANATYNVVSGSDTRSGQWTLNQAGCKLILDQNTANERSFEIITASTDSLIIWRRDATINGAYTQHYKKH